MRKSYLFLGVYTKTWHAGDFDPVIALCKATGITGLLVKVYEYFAGEWYGGTFPTIYQHITSAGLECIPYGFHYGNGNGSNLQKEAEVALKFMGKYGQYCMDAESDWDGHTAWGQSLASIWKGHPGKLWVSTWANPQDHQWLGIIDALKGEVQAWMPQVYSDKLGDKALAQWPHNLVLQPTVGIVGDGDPNHPERLVNLFGQGDLSIWEYREAIAHMNPLAAIMRAFRGAAVPQPAAQGGTSVVTLQHFPMIAERTPITADGHPPEDAGLSCVPASLLAGVMYLLGVKSIGGKYTPDSLKDAVYGQGYVGGMSAARYVGYLAKEFGITLTSFKGTPAALVAETHRQIAAGRPVVFTIPNPYGNPAYTHVCCFYGMGQRTLTAMDPWIAKPVTKSDATWAGLLQYNEVWIMSKIGVDEMQPLTIADVKQFFTENPDKSWTRIDKAGKPVLDSLNKPIVLKGAMKDDWCAHGTLALADIGLPTGNATQVDTAHPEVVAQQFERCIRRLDPNHIEDSPPHAGPVYSVHIESMYVTQEKLSMTLDQLAATQKQLATAQMDLQVGGDVSQSTYIAAVQAAKPHVQALSDILAPLAIDPAAASKGAS